MKLFIILITTFILTFFIPVNLFEEKYNNGQVKIQCSIDNGLIDGKYTTWYQNGQKKLEGSYCNNQKVGVWSIWNNEGELIVQRKFKNSFQFEIIKSKYSIQVDTNEYQLIYNEKSFIESYMLEEKDVLWAKETWRTIENSDLNSKLFEANKLYKLIYRNLIETDNLKAYSDTNLSNLFSEELSQEQLKQINGKYKSNVIKYLVKEQNILDKKRKILETAIIGICPIVEDMEGNTKRLFWIYFPTLRPILAKEKVTNKLYTENIKTIDDLFFFRDFNSNLIPQINDSDIEAKKQEREKNYQFKQKKLETEIVEIETEAWIDFFRKEM